MKQTTRKKYDVFMGRRTLYHQNKDPPAKATAPFKSRMDPKMLTF